MNDETVHQLCKQAVAQVIWLNVLDLVFSCGLFFPFLSGAFLNLNMLGDLHLASLTSFT